MPAPKSWVVDELTRHGRAGRLWTDIFQSPDMMSYLPPKVAAIVTRARQIKDMLPREEALRQIAVQITGTDFPKRKLRPAPLTDVGTSPMEDVALAAADYGPMAVNLALNLHPGLRGAAGVARYAPDILGPAAQAGLEYVAGGRTAGDIAKGAAANIGAGAGITRVLGSELSPTLKGLAGGAISGGTTAAATGGDIPATIGSTLLGLLGTGWAASVQRYTPQPITPEMIGRLAQIAGVTPEMIDYAKRASDPKLAAGMLEVAREYLGNEPIRQASRNFLDNWRRLAERSIQEGTGVSAIPSSGAGAVEAGERIQAAARNAAQQAQREVEAGVVAQQRAAIQPPPDAVPVSQAYEEVDRLAGVYPQQQLEEAAAQLPVGSPEIPERPGRFRIVEEPGVKGKPSTLRYVKEPGVKGRPSTLRYVKEPGVKGKPSTLRYVKEPGTPEQVIPPTNAQYTEAALKINQRLDELEQPIKESLDAFISKLPAEPVSDAAVDSLVRVLRTLEPGLLEDVSPAQRTVRSAVDRIINSATEITEEGARRPVTYQDLVKLHGALAERARMAKAAGDTARESRWLRIQRAVYNRINTRMFPVNPKVMQEWDDARRRYVEIQDMRRVANRALEKASGVVKRAGAYRERTLGATPQTDVSLRFFKRAVKPGTEEYALLEKTGLQGVVPQEQTIPGTPPRLRVEPKEFGVVEQPPRLRVEPKEFGVVEQPPRLRVEPKEFGVVEQPPRIRLDVVDAGQVGSPRVPGLMPGEIPTVEVVRRVATELGGETAATVNSILSRPNPFANFRTRLLPKSPDRFGDARRTHEMLMSLMKTDPATAAPIMADISDDLWRQANGDPKRYYEIIREAVGEGAGWLPANSPIAQAGLLDENILSKGMTAQNFGRFASQIEGSGRLGQMFKIAENYLGPNAPRYWAHLAQSMDPKSQDLNQLRAAFLAHLLGGDAGSVQFDKFSQRILGHGQEGFTPQILESILGKDLYERFKLLGEIADGPGKVAARAIDTEPNSWTSVVRSPAAVAGAVNVGLLGSVFGMKTGLVTGPLFAYALARPALLAKYLLSGGVPAIDKLIQALQTSSRLIANKPSMARGGETRRGP